MLALYDWGSSCKKKLILIYNVCSMMRNNHDVRCYQPARFICYIHDLIKISWENCLQSLPANISRCLEHTQSRALQYVIFVFLP